MDYRLIQYSVNEGVASIVLNRPDVLNAFNRNMATEVQHALELAGDSSSVRCILLSGAGRGFCSGQDLQEAIANKDLPIKKIVEKTYNPIVRAIRNIEKPVVCAVHGTAAGAGANIALACDIVLAAKDATFVQAFCKIGLIPDSGGTFTLPRLVGFAKASALMMLGEKVSGEQAAAMGMIYRACDTATLAEEAKQLAKNLATQPTKGLGLTKRLLNQAFTNSFEQQLTAEAEVQSQAGATYDFQEGVKAFLEKRKPQFQGK